MSENKSLEDCVRDWANNNSERAHRWCAEIKQNDIDDIQALEKIAKSPDWEDFLRAFKPPLRTYMREFGGKYKSKFLVIMS
jgi:hypothetical protein